MVKLLSAPALVPELFVAVIRRWQVESDSRPVRVTLTGVAEKPVTGLWPPQGPGQPC